MDGKSVSVFLLMLATVSLAGSDLLTAQEPAIRGSRATPKQIRDSFPEAITLRATAAHTIGRSIQELRILADDMEKAGQRAEAVRLRNIIKEIVRRSELELADKKAHVIRLNEEMEDLKMIVEQ